mmetsp:Transcript_35614/g.81518  ORF Transcript_35614/g.81518 Transcript_35614/m.81518 type:complete len:85 (+) Transcript_35614:708-962(+)
MVEATLVRNTLPALETKGRFGLCTRQDRGAMEALGVPHIESSKHRKRVQECSTYIVPAKAPYANPDNLFDLTSFDEAPFAFAAA